MPFKKGEGGRPKGCQNEQTKDIKSIIQRMLNHLGKDQKIEDMLDTLEVEDPKIIIAFLAKVAPKSLEVKESKGKSRLLIEMEKANE